MVATFGPHDSGNLQHKYDCNYNSLLKRKQDKDKRKCSNNWLLDIDIIWLPKSLNAYAITCGGNNCVLSKQCSLCNILQIFTSFF